MKIYNPNTGWKLIKEEIVLRTHYGNKINWLRGLALDNLFLRKLPKFLSKIDRIDGYFYCFLNKLTSLENCPQIIDGDFSCSSNDLISLKGGPKIVKQFDCSNNKLTSLKWCPIRVRGTFWCTHNSKQFTKKEVLKYCNIDKYPDGKLKMFLIINYDL